MTMINSSERQNLDLCSQSTVWWRQALFLGIIGLGVFLLLMPNTGRQRNAVQPESRVSQHAPERAQPSSDMQRSTFLDPAYSRFALGRSLPTPAPADVWPRERQTEPSMQPPEP